MIARFVMVKRFSIKTILLALSLKENGLINVFCLL